MQEAPGAYGPYEALFRYFVVRPELYSRRNYLRGNLLEAPSAIWASADTLRAARRGYPFRDESGRCPIAAFT